jgi:hypothetical protein
MEWVSNVTKILCPPIGQDVPRSAGLLATETSPTIPSPALVAANFDACDQITISRAEPVEPLWCTDINMLSRRQQIPIIARRRAHEVRHALRVHAFTSKILELIAAYAETMIQSASLCGATTLVVQDDGALFVQPTRASSTMRVHLPFRVARVEYSVLHATDGGLWQYEDDGRHVFTRLRSGDNIPVAPYVWRDTDSVRVTKWARQFAIPCANAISVTVSGGFNVTVLFRDRIVRSTPNGTVVSVPVPHDLEFVTVCSGYVYVFALTKDGHLYARDAAVKEDVFAKVRHNIRTIVPLCPNKYTTDYGCVMLTRGGRLIHAIDVSVTDGKARRVKSGVQFVCTESGVRNLFSGLYDEGKHGLNVIRSTNGKTDDSDSDS